MKTSACLQALAFTILAAFSHRRHLDAAIHGLKQQLPNTLLMFRLGDYYELFYEDAVTAARELESHSQRGIREGPADPDVRRAYHSAENYIARLTPRDRVAICEQMERTRPDKVSQAR
jgi:DNA mismatch repair protein MutS